MARDPNQIPLADDVTGADTAEGDPPGDDWSTPIWSLQASIRRLSNQLGKTQASWRDAYLTAGKTKGADGVGMRCQVPTLTAASGVFFVWLVNSGFDGSPTGYTIRFAQGAGAGGTDFTQLQRWDAGVATELDLADFTLGAGDWLAIIADTSGVEYWSSTDGSTWTSRGVSADVTLTGTLNGGLETSDGTVRFDNVYYGIAVSTQTVTPTGIASGEAFGTAEVSPGPVTLSPTGIASEEVLGTAGISAGPVTIEALGIASAEEFGAAALEIAGARGTPVAAGSAAGRSGVTGAGSGGTRGSTAAAGAGSGRS